MVLLLTTSVLQEPPRSTERDRLEPSPIKYQGSVRIATKIMELPKDLTMYCEEDIAALSEPQRTIPMNEMFQQDNFLVHCVLVRQSNYI
jgi:hypothetical protein